MNPQFMSAQNAADMAGRQWTAPQATSVAPPQSVQGLPPVSLGGMRDWSALLNGQNLPTNQSHTINAQAAVTDPDKGQAALTRAQWAFFKDQIRPYEDEALAFVMDKRRPDSVAQDVGTRTARFFDNPLAAGTADRTLGRAGIRQTGEQRAAGERSRDLTRATSIVSNKNQARRETRDIQTALSTDIGNIAQGYSASASDAMSAAGGMATGRNQANAAASAAKRQSMISSTAMGAGMGYMGAKAGMMGASVAGPAGAVIGAGLGLALSLLG